MLKHIVASKTAKGRQVAVNAGAENARAENARAENAGAENARARIISAGLLLLAIGLIASTQVGRAQDENGQGAGVQGSAGGSSPGSPGMEDNEAVYKNLVRHGLAKGKNSREHIGSLIALGMHYNRQQRFAEAAKTLREALAIVDGGALKPTKDENRRPDRIIEEQHQNGTVSAQVIRTPMPYEETLQELLPQLSSAEIGCNQLSFAENHLKRLISLKGPNDVSDKVTLMSAYTQYAELLRKLHRNKEAEEYQGKADAINKSFKPL